MNVRVFFVLGLAWAVYHTYFKQFLEEYEPWYQDSAQISFYIFQLLFIWSLAQTVLTDPGTPSKDYMPVSQQTDSCDICKSFKPERCQHCQVCGKCRLGLDHHNTVLGICIAFRNKKFYILTLFYSSAALLNVITSCTPIVLQGHTEGHRGAFQRLVLFAGYLVLCGALVGELMAAVRRMAENVMKVDEVKNKNGREGKGKQQESLHWMYNNGAFENFYEVFGDSWGRWLLPLHGSQLRLADGYSWTKNQ